MVRFFSIFWVFGGVFGLLFGNTLFAQNGLVTHYTLPLQAKDTCIVNECNISSFVVFANQVKSIQGLKITSNSFEYIPQIDWELSENQFRSELIFVSEKTNTMCIRSGVIDTVYIDVFHVPSITLESTNLTEKVGGCTMPTVVSQAVWRNGLPEPNYERLHTKTKNIIIHHSAGSNTEPNYIDVIRNIYVYHTQSNEWSDIGYNYLIAQDGTVFAGRDPGPYAQDEVYGAHFCAANMGTMGICLLGNYENSFITDSAQNSLLQLITWKCMKDNLNPLGISSHILNGNLSVIAGHQNGCSTLCPGKNVYELLPTYRQLTLAAMQECGYVLPQTNFAQVMFKDIIEPFEIITVKDILGNTIFEGEFARFQNAKSNSQVCFIQRTIDGKVYPSLL